MAGNRRNMPQDASAAALEMLTQALNNQAATNAAVLEEIRRGIHNQDRMIPVPNDHQATRFSEFRRINPPVFSGQYDPMAALAWLKETEKILSVIGCTEEQRVNYATFMLRGGAENWWAIAKDRFAPPDHPLNWDNFSRVFLDKYFPLVFRRQKEEEFMRLTQGSRTVGQYVAKFEELSQFSYVMKHHPDEAWKCTQLEGGLRPEIKNIVGVFEIRDFPTLVNKCLIVERNLEESRIHRSYDRKRKREEVPARTSFRNFKPIENSSGLRPEEAPYPSSFAEEEPHPSSSPH